ncbi:acetyl-CoA acyltransferase [Actinopolyspora biskrensis]|uniref:Probable acetyl-CoA acetyltransferase n=1 Tax=Actinopolyspora biskrensis TaxID=1470178 RepID=A0A852Z3U4_9ACTN|nr:thiolase family protein [Actinopolyspora biskrensis]NYH80419.1 acetyl-CoA acyltransferase [Actinopolyspora biskrensis]
MARALLIDAARTPFGGYRGELSGVRVDDLAAMPITELLRRDRARAESALDPNLIDEVVYGNTNGAGEENRNVARMAGLLAGLPTTVPGMTVNRLCGSSGEALVQASRAIRSGEAELVIAGGVEGMSRAPFVLPRSERVLPDRLDVVSTAAGWRLVNPRMNPEWTVPLGLAAERTAEELGIGRTEMDEYALRSHRRAAAAWDAGVHDGFVFPLRDPRGITVRGDESVRTDTGMTKLGGLSPAFSSNGPVTVGNSAPLGDGAVAALIGSREQAERMGSTPLGELLTGVSVACEPHRFALAPVTAIRKLLDRLDVGLAQVDLWEINEAFAALVLTVLRHLPDIPLDRVNVHGGALAYGHPLGASFARVVVDLCRHLGQRGGGLGVATAGIGVGQATAVAVRV